jgi:protein associated with RNAse G/E
MTKDFLKELSNLDKWIDSFLLSLTFHKHFILQTRQMKKLKEDLDIYIYFVCAFDLIDHQMYEILKKQYLYIINTCFVKPVKWKKTNEKNKLIG